MPRKSQIRKSFYIRNDRRFWAARTRNSFTWSKYYGRKCLFLFQKRRTVEVKFKERKKQKTFTIFLSWHFFCSSWFQGLRWVPMTVYCKKLTSKYLLVLWGWPDFDWEGKYGFSVPRMRYILQIKFAYYILTKWMNFSIKCNILNNYNFNNFDNICITRRPQKLKKKICTKYSLLLPCNFK